MVIIPKLIDNIKNTFKGSYLLYPISIIVAIPLLLVINTFWNLRSFNRDINFLIRHQAVSVTDTIKPQVVRMLKDGSNLNELLTQTRDSNSEIISITVIKELGNKIVVVSTTDKEIELGNLEKMGLNQLAVGFNQPVAGLSYDAEIGKNVWNVSVPMEKMDDSNYLLFLKFRVDKVEEILGRTARDSYIILAMLILATLVLLINHFIFFRKAQKTRELEELDKLKDEFISMAAHELKAPMTGLLGYLELLKEKISPSEKEKIAEDFKILNMLIKDLDKLINDLLDVSRIAQGRLKIEIKDVNVNVLLEDVIKTFIPVASQKNLTLNLQSGENLPLIKSDPDRIRQVVTNLVSNSIKYSLKGQIEIASTIKDNYIFIEVKDGGIGIPASEMPNLFSKFHRVKDRQTIEVRGTGLGLWITKKIVEMLGGKITVESIYGTGSKFSFTIPLTA